MSEYFEPVSVLSLGSILGLAEIDGDTLRRWFHGLAQGAINFEDDPAQMGRSRTRRARRSTASSRRSSSGSGRRPDSSTIATMLQHAEGTFDERVATILPTLKVILLGGMQEPGHAAGTTVAGLLESGQAAARRRRSRRSRAGRDRGGPALGLADRDADAARQRSRPSSAASTLPVGRESRSARLLGQPRRGGLGADRRCLRPVSAEAQPRAPSASGRTSAPAITSRACRCGSRCSGSSSGSRTCARTPTGRRSSTAGSSAPRSTSTSGGTPDVGRMGVDLGPADLADGELREATAEGLSLVVARSRRSLRRVRDVVLARGVPSQRRLARGRGDPLRLPRRAVLAGRRRCRSKGPRSTRSPLSKHP